MAVALHRKTRYLSVNGKVAGALVWMECKQEAVIHYHDAGLHPQIVKFPLWRWPPTDDDIKRAEVVLAMHRR